ncbi:MAG: helix-turn-helix domain-containing protein [Limosilactobacillus pontis]|uniref:Cupin n=1 Tax=Limosilactobacillus pontis TaxID=35787 RepID=A0A2J6NMK0_9LACO|nr:AraC family transcriptional regulator [Limosilactobacillus pontis]PMB82446.1 cupin [Limosilactobacillus pontis]
MVQNHHENVVVNTNIGIRFWRSSTGTSGYVPFHWHSSIEIVCVFDGRLDFNIEGQLFILKSGQFIIVPSGAVHSVANTPNRAMVFQIPISTLERYLDYPEKVDFKNGQVDLPEYKTIVKLIKHFGEVDIAQTDGYKFDSEIILLKILKIIFTKFARQRSFVASNNQLKNVIIYINQNYQEQLTVNLLARRFGYNPSYLSRIFKEQTGISLLKYIYGVRINRFYQDILKTDRPIKKLMQENGLNNERTARKTFKEMFGILPSALRRQGNK